MAGNTVYVSGNYVDVHDNEVVNLSIDKAGEVRVDKNMAAGETQAADEGVVQDQNSRILHAIEVMQQEGLFRFKYDYAWLKVIMDSTEGLPSFRSAQSFVDYLKELGVKDVPSESSISRYMDMARGQHPNWSFSDTKDERECQRRNLVASRFLSLVRKGA